MFGPGLFVRKSRLPLADALAVLSSPPPGWKYYINLSPAMKSNAKDDWKRPPLDRGLFAGMQLPHWLPKGSRKVRELNLWLAQPKAGRINSQLHVDPHDNIISCIAGRKEIVLLDPTSAPLLQYGASVEAVRSNGLVEFAGHKSAGVEQATAHFSSIRFKDSELWKQERQGLKPSCNKSNGLRWTAFQVLPGDSIFIPAGWAHQISSMPEERPKSQTTNENHVDWAQTTAIALNLWFDPPPVAH